MRLPDSAGSIAQFHNDVDAAIFAKLISVPEARRCLARRRLSP
jgi:hypothetical protein